MNSQDQPHRSDASPENNSPDAEEPERKKRSTSPGAASRMGLWEWHPEDDVLKVDDPSTSLLGEQPDDIAELLNRFHPDHRPELRKALERTARGQQDLHEYCQLFGDESDRWIELTARTVEDAEGEPVRVIGSLRSVISAEDDRKDTSTRSTPDQDQTYFRYAVESSGHGVIMTDPDGVITYVNPAFEEMTGYSRSEVLGQTPNILNSDRHDESFFRELWETIRAGNVWKGEIINQTRSGNLIHTQQTIAPVVNDEGELTAYISIQEDITEQKERERELLEKSRAIENSPIGIVMTDPTKEDNPLCYINKGFEKLTGYNREEILGRNCRFLQGDETDPESVERIRQAVSEEEMIKIEIRNYRKDGEMFWNQLIISPIHDREGNLTRYVGYQQDVTQRKRSEQQLQVFRDSINKSPVEIFILDPDTARFLDVSDSVPDDLGYSREELLNMTAPDVNPDVGDTIDWDEQVREMKQNGSIRLESRHRRKDGSTFPVEIHADHVVVDGTARIVASAHDISERLDKKRKMKRQAQLLNRINNRMPGISFQFRRDPDGSYSFPYMSKGFKQFAGISSMRAREDFNCVLEQVHPEDRDALLDSIEQSADTMTPWTFVWRYLHPEGSETWCRGSSLPEEQPDGSIVWTGVFVDITEEKERYRELNVQKKRFQTLFDNAPIGLWEEDWSEAKDRIEQLPYDDPDMIADYLDDHPEVIREVAKGVEVILPNETVVEFTGANNKQHLIDHFDQILTEDTFTSFRHELVGLLRGQTSHSSTMSIRRFDGEERTVLRDFQLVPGHDSDWSRVFVSYRDITRRVEMQESLRRSEDRYRTLFEEANEAFLIKNLDDRILAANQSACALLGYDRDELVGLTSADIRPSDLVDEYPEDSVIQSIMAEHGQSLFLTEYLHRDGSRIPVEAKFQPFDYDEDTPAVMACLRDRSELEQIRQESSRKSSFVSRVTHDLRTPLNSILGMGQLLLETDLSPEQQERLRVMLNATRTMERLTNDILDLDRIEQGKITLDRETFNLHNLLGEVMSMYSNLISDRNLMITSSISADVPEMLYGDPNRLKQTLHNLVENAVKHTHEGRIEISAQVKERSSEDIILQFDVSDTGKGIPEDQRSNIFNRGEQLDGGDSSSTSGLGLGLSICQAFVDLMDGEISVESEVGKGTTFTFTAEFTEGSDRPGASLDGLRVLIVDDNEHVLNVFRSYLEANNIEAVSFTSGRQVLEELRESTEDTPYDVVFMDHRLGDVSGLDVLKKLEENGGMIDPGRIYLVTGDPREDLQAELDDISIAGILEKPVSESSMIGAITTAVHHEGKDPENTETLLESIQARISRPLHVLLVEDNPDTQNVLKTFLGPIAGDVTVTTTGQKALEAYDEGPDLILMDVELAGALSGFEVTREIRRREQERSIEPVPIICQTALAMKHVEKRCRDSGADEFLRQPLERGDLYRAIFDVLNDQGADQGDDSSESNA